MGFLDAVTSLATKIAENIASGENPKHDADSIRKDASEAGAQAKAFGAMASGMLAKTVAGTVAAAAPLAKSVLGAASEMAKAASNEFTDLHGKVDAFAMAKAASGAAPTAAAPAAPTSSVAEKVQARRSASQPTAAATEPSKPAAKTSA